MVINVIFMGYQIGDKDSQSPCWILDHENSNKTRLWNTLKYFESLSNIIQP